MLKKPTVEEKMEAYKTIEIGGRYANLKALFEPKNLAAIAVGIAVQIILLAMFVRY